MNLLNEPNTSVIFVSRTLLTLTLLALLNSQIIENSIDEIFGLHWQQVAIWTNPSFWTNNFGLVEIPQES